MVDARQALQPGWGPFWQVASAMSDREPSTDEVEGQQASLDRERSPDRRRRSR